MRVPPHTVCHIYIGGPQPPPLLPRTSDGTYVYHSGGQRQGWGLVSNPSPAFPALCDPLSGILDECKASTGGRVTILDPAGRGAEGGGDWVEMWSGQRVRVQSLALCSTGG
mmetsp:Transcript_107668/g.185649  ORF Transcript_107668/g.185649 Transcript_107668/m.185649 type:complete len:111 (+) Transcript_107668:58-390(+)